MASEAIDQVRIGYVVCILRGLAISKTSCVLTNKGVGPKLDLGIYRLVKLSRF